MASREAWRTLEGTELQDGVVLRELVEVVPSPLFRAESRSGAVLLVRFWGRDYGDPQTIVDRHHEARFLDHPGLLRCVQAGLATSGDNQYAYAVFEGPDALLADYLHQGPLSTAEAQTLGSELANALEYLHARELVYCALDPWTVAKKHDRWTLADYSQMRLTGEVNASETRRLLVSFPATPPEAYEGRVSPAWDAWSLAHLLRTSLLGVARRKPHDRSQAAPDVPEPFGGVLSACTVMNPDERCTVREIAERLGGVPADTRAPIAAAPAPRVEAAQRPVPPPPPRDRVSTGNRRTMMMILAGVAALLLVIFLLARGRGAPEAADRAQQPAAQTQPDPNLPNPVEMPPATEAAAMSTRSRAATEAEIRDVVNRWTTSFRSRDLGTHLSLYAPSVERFFLSRNVPLSRVRQTKEKALQSAGDIRQYVVENVNVKLQSPTRATVSFDKTYEFAKNAGKVRGELYLRKINDEWRISGERDVRVYWQRKA